MVGAAKRVEKLEGRDTGKKHRGRKLSDFGANACTKTDEIGALMRRHGAYSSSMSTWRH